MKFWYIQIGLLYSHLKINFNVRSVSNVQVIHNFCFFKFLLSLLLRRIQRDTTSSHFIYSLLNFDFLGEHWPVRSDAKHQFCGCPLLGWPHFVQVWAFFLGGSLPSWHSWLSRAICASAMKEIILLTYIYQTSRLLNPHWISHAK